MIDASHIAEFLKVIFRPRYLFGIWFPALLLLVLPIAILARIGLDTFAIEFRTWITLAFLPSFGIWLSVSLVQAFDFVRDWSKKRSSTRAREISQEENQEKRLKLFDDLSQGEWFYLLMSLKRGERVFLTFFQNRHAISLQAKKFVVGQAQGDMFEFPFYISDWAWKYLQNNRDDLLRDNDDWLENFISQYRATPDYARKQFP